MFVPKRQEQRAPTFEFSQFRFFWVSTFLTISTFRWLLATFLCCFLEVNLAILPGGHAQFSIFTKYIVVLGFKIWFHQKNRNSEKLKFSKKTWNCQQNRNSEKSKLKNNKKCRKYQKKINFSKKSLHFQKSQFSKMLQFWLFVKIHFLILSRCFDTFEFSQFRFFWVSTFFDNFDFLMKISSYGNFFVLFSGGQFGNFARRSRPIFDFY